MGEIAAIVPTRVNPQSGLSAKVNKVLTSGMFPIGFTTAAMALFGQVSAMDIGAGPSAPKRAGTVAVATARATIIRAEQVIFSSMIKPHQSRVTGEIRHLIEFE